MRTVGGVGGVHTVVDVGEVHTVGEVSGVHIDSGVGVVRTVGGAVKCAQ